MFQIAPHDVGTPTYVKMSVARTAVTPGEDSLIFARAWIALARTRGAMWLTNKYEYHPMSDPITHRVSETSRSQGRAATTALEVASWCASLPSMWQVHLQTSAYRDSSSSDMQSRNFASTTACVPWSDLAILHNASITLLTTAIFSPLSKINKQFGIKQSELTATGVQGVVRLPLLWIRGAPGLLVEPMSIAGHRRSGIPGVRARSPTHRRPQQPARRRVIWQRDIPARLQSWPQWDSPPC